MNIIEKYKSSTSKLNCIGEIATETGMDVVDIIAELIEAKCIDGRLLANSIYEDEWKEAKDKIKNSSVERAASSAVSLKSEIERLNAENDKLRAENDEYAKMYDTLLEESDELRKKIEELENQHEFAVDEAEGDSMIIRELMEKNRRLEDKLAKAEEFILNQVVYS